MNYLLDTCVVSEIVRPRPNNDMIAWLERSSNATLYISAITIGEIQRGISRLDESVRRKKLINFIDELLSTYSERILPLTIETSRQWGRLCEKLDRKGRPLPILDSLIAATALEHQFTVVTRNIADFSDTGVKLLNIWEGN